MAKILVVDDEFGIGELLRDVLSDEGHEVELAINGRQGLDRMAGTKPDLIFLDFMMPVLDGAGVLRAMAVEPALSQIPVIVMSSLPEATIESRAQGYTHYVRKPFRIDTIIRLAATTLADGDGPAVDGHG
jgi:CheY-like chemotaxis protein